MNCEPGGAELDQIEAIYRRRLPEFRRVATAITGDRDVAVDAVQEAFALAVYKRGQFRGDGSVEGWLWRIVVRTARDAARRSAPVSRLARNNAAADSIWCEDEGQGRLRVLVAELPERQRVAPFLFYYADLDYAAIAARLRSVPAPSAQRSRRPGRTCAG